MNYAATQSITTPHHILHPMQQVKKKTGKGIAFIVCPTQATSKTPEQMLEIIAMALDMSSGCYRLRSRERNIVELRFISALFLRRNFPLITLQQIAALFGGQDHSSVISGLARAYDLIYIGDERFLKKYNTVLHTIDVWLREEDSFGKMSNPAA